MASWCVGGLNSSAVKDVRSFGFVFNTHCESPFPNQDKISRRLKEQSEAFARWQRPSVASTSRSHVFGGVVGSTATTILENELETLEGKAKGHILGGSFAE